MIKTLSSKVRSALIYAIGADLALSVTAITGTLPWIGFLAAVITSLIPVVAAYQTTETIYPPEAKP